MVGALFTVLMIACCGYAFLAGRWEGKCATIMFFAAGLLSIPAANLNHNWNQTQLPVLGVDLVLLAGLWIVTERSRSFWPVWVFGLHLANIATHIATLISGGWRAEIYQSMQAFWSVPELLIMVWGIMLDRRPNHERCIVSRKKRSAEDRGSKSVG